MNELMTILSIEKKNSAYIFSRVRQCTAVAVGSTACVDMYSRAVDSTACVLDYSCGRWHHCMCSRVQQWQWAALQVFSCTAVAVGSTAGVLVHSSGRGQHFRCSRVQLWPSAQLPKMQELSHTVTECGKIVNKMLCLLVVP